MPNKVADLKPAPYNPRVISKERLAALGKSLREFGDLSGVVFNKRTGHVISGHQRIKHMDPAWVIKRDAIQTPWGALHYREVDWTETKEKAANLAANKHGGDFDIPGVQKMLDELMASGFDTDLTGYLPGDRGLKNHEIPDSVDEAPAPPKTPRTKAGDLWLLGAHRVLCADATKKESWKKLFEDKNVLNENAACVYTDPPYGVSYESRTGKFEIIEGDDKRRDALLALLVPAFTLAAKYANDNAAFYIWHASSTREDFVYALKAAGLVERQYLIWSKPSAGLGYCDYRWSHEPCFYASKDGKKPAFHGNKGQTTVWQATLRTKNALSTTVGAGVTLTDGDGNMIYITSREPSGRKVRTLRIHDKAVAHLTISGDETDSLWEVGRDRNYQHPTQKPVELAHRAITNSMQPNQIVCDPFLGSGTTLIAAELGAEICYGMELDPKYVDVIVSRWEEVTGRKAVKESK